MASTSVSATTSITNSIKSIQSSGNVDLSLNLGTYSLSQWNTIIFKLDNSLNGVTPNFANLIDQSNYNYYVFHDLNMVMAQKKTTNIVNSVGISTISSSNNYQSTFRFSWVKIFNNLNTPQFTNPYTIKYSSPDTVTLNFFTSFTSTILTKVQGSETQGSSCIYSLTFATPIVPLYGEIKVLFVNTTFTSDTGAHCRVGTNILKSTLENQVLRCYRTSDGFRIAGFSQISVATTITIYFYIKSIAAANVSTISVDIYGVYDNSLTRVALSNVGTVTHIADSVPFYIYRV